ncbi:Smr/MutS family protein [Thiomonas sp. FB-6]|uniref:Smr/MutS family protein n=1 Tax=Thiomonas sp. FB-6 TaxID=1158291 RepID=UPI0003758A1C|nr:Smr/MutS family protein [Thiomonas sp. FB-6]
MSTRIPRRSRSRAVPAVTPRPAADDVAPAADAPRQPEPPDLPAEAAAASPEGNDETRLFLRAVAGAQLLPEPDRVLLRPAPPPPIPRQRLRDERAALHESLSDSVDLDSLLETDQELSYRAPGIGPDVLRKLRRGHWVIQAELDLHGLRRDEARAALLEFTHAAQQRGARCLRVIHGKGLGSPGREGVLRHKVRGWLLQMRDVLAFCQAGPHDGGAGSLLVLLRGQPAPGPRHPR